MRIKIYDGVSPELILFTVLMLAVMAFVFFIVRIRPVFCEYAQSEACSRAIRIMSSAAETVFDDEKVTYDKLIHLKHNNNGQVTALEADTVIINRIKAEISEILDRSFAAFTEADIAIPAGSMLKTPVFQGYGPEIHMKFAPTNNLNIEFSDEFTSCGINQVKHGIYLDITAVMTVYCAGFKQDENVSTHILIAETVIVGAVPEYYGNTGVIANSKK